MKPALAAFLLFMAAYQPALAAPEYSDSYCAVAAARSAVATEMRSAVLAASDVFLMQVGKFELGVEVLRSRLVQEKDGELSYDVGLRDPLLGGEQIYRVRIRTGATKRTCNVASVTLLNSSN